MAKTKEERFIISLYESAKLTGDQYAVLDRYAVGARIGLQPRGVNAITRTLAQANFIKVLGRTEIKLSPNGLELVQTLTGIK